MSRLSCWSSFFTAAIALLVYSDAFGGGPWVQPKLKGYSEMSGSYGLSSWLDQATIQYYGELGVGKGFNVKLILPFVYAGTKRDNDLEFTPPAGSGSLFSISNIIVGAKYQVLKKKVSFGVGLDIGMRTFASDTSKGLRTGYEKWFFKPYLSAGMGFSQGYFYVDGFAEFATNKYGHGVGLIAEGGYWADETILISIYATIVKTFDNGTFNTSDGDAYSFTGFFIDEQNYLSIGPKLMVKVKSGFGVNFGVFRDFSFRNNSGLLSLKAGLFYKWE